MILFIDDIKRNVIRDGNNGRHNENEWCQITHYCIPHNIINVTNSMNINYREAMAGKKRYNEFPFWKPLKALKNTVHRFKGFSDMFPPFSLSQRYTGNITNDEKHSNIWNHYVNNHHITFFLTFFHSTNFPCFGVMIFWFNTRDKCVGVVYINKTKTPNNLLGK